MVNEMSESVLVAIITGCISLVGIFLSYKSTNNNIQNQLKVHQAVTDTKIDELCREVREHNGFAKRLPVVENDVQTLYRKIDKLENRINA